MGQMRADWYHQQSEGGVGQCGARAIKDLQREDKTVLLGTMGNRE